MSNDIYIWQGFQHDWLRRVAGFATPHRISKFENFLSQEDGGRFHFGQATGVDGNYMRPVGFYAGLRAPGLVAQTERVSFEWTDEIEGEPPQARSDVQQTLRVDLSAPPFSGLTENHAVVLSGFRLNSKCDGAKQPRECPCNSDGLWPFRMAIEVGPSTRSGDRLEAVVSAHIYRAWTPMKGGLPPLEIKPLNARLDLSLEVHLTVLGGPDDALCATSGPDIRATAEARCRASTISASMLEGVPERYPKAVSALTAFGFELLQTGKAKRNRHLGRYISNLRFHLEDDRYDPERGRMAVRHHSQLWLPKTVVASDVRYTMRSMLLQIGPEAASSFSQAIAQDRLCFNSTEQAPFFSRWCGCDDPDKGPEQSETSVPLVMCCR